MKHTTLAVFAAVVSLLGAPTTAQVIWEDTCGPPLGGLYAADPAGLAAAWLPQLERLYAGIPSLSPREEQWLEEEMQGDGDRAVRAVSSLEHALREAKQNAGSLLATVRFSPKTRDQAEQTKYWLLFAYTLIESSSDLNLAGLVAEKVIQREAIPDQWIWQERTGAPLQDSIRWGRERLARHVLICTLPSILGLSMRE